MILSRTTRPAIVAALLLALLLPTSAMGKKKKESAGGPPPAETAEPAPLPAAADLFARNVEAMGGEAAIREHRAQHARATMTIPLQGLTATIQVWAEAPDRIYTAMEMPGIGAFESGFDGTVGWSSDPMSGAALQEGAELVQSRRDAAFYADLDYATRYPEMETVGRVQWGAYRAYEVRVTTPEGKEETVYFDQDGGMKIGSERLTETDMGPMPIRMVCEDPREFSGIMLATRCTESTGAIEGNIVFESIEFDPPDFALPPLPAVVQALVDEQAARAGGAAAPEGTGTE